LGRESEGADGFSFFDFSRNLGIIAVIVLLFVAVDWMRLRFLGRRRATPATAQTAGSGAAGVAPKA